MPPASNSVRKLLADPFGPFWDEDILTNECRSTTLHRPLILADLQLECGGRPIGLTRTEPSQPEYDRNRVLEQGVLFRGILEVTHLSWLTETARARIEGELRQRDIQSRIRNGGNLRSTLTLNLVFGAMREKIKVMIQGKKNLTAGYLTSTRVPDGLQLTSEHMNRVYAVYSMDVTTYDLSRTYLSRYRTLHILRQLLKLDTEEAGTYENTTPLNERTPQWFADLYIRHMATPSSAKHRRILHDSDDSDIDSENDWDANATIPGKLKEGRSRTLRHVPRAEVLSLIARHVAWLIEDQKRSSRQTTIIDVDVWRRWAQKASAAKKVARQEGIPWGQTWDEDLTDEVGHMSIDRPRSTRTRQNNRQTNRQRNALQLRTAVASTSAVVRSTARRTRPSRSVSLPPEDDDDEGPLSRYDPEFSPSSSSESAWESDSSFSSLPEPYDPEIGRLIPPQFYYPPTISPNAWTWHCEFPTCDYSLDMRKLSERDTRALPREDAERLRFGRWSLAGKWARAQFLFLVSQHRDEHIDELGIVVKSITKNRATLLWKKPELHRHWPPASSHHDAPQAAAVKQEPKDRN